MAKVKYIRCDIYKRGIDIFIGTPEELQKWSKKTFNEDKDDEEFNRGLEECSYGAADFHYGNGYAVVRIPEFPKNPTDTAALVHELFHATAWLLWYSGVEFDNRNSNNEAYTYLLEHLTRNALETEGYEEVDFSE